MIDELTVAAEKAEPPVRDVTGLIADGVAPEKAACCWYIPM
ncbi:Uncharacterised protein [Mycobacterium tuberculosis]|nr:Uncharacterised protein [Mycobacterium tuberculosis]